MANPLVSVVIPAYRGAETLGETIRSVLAQSYANFELIVVDDMSPDNTVAVVEEFADPRIRLILHEQNRGAGFARDTGTRNARGELIAFLDQDDAFHREKLALHVAHFAANPDVGASYAGRFDLIPSDTTIRDIWLMPHPVTLADLVLGFPITPSDLVLRREFALRPDIDAVHAVFHGGETIRYGRLYLDGCKFAPVQRALSYRRYYAGRTVHNLEANCRSYIYAQNVILDDPRCPPEVKALRNRAHTNSYLVWISYAFAQQETELGQKLLRSALELTPELTEGPECELTRCLLINSMDDDQSDHEALLRSMFAQLPPDVAHIQSQLEPAITAGYLARGTRAVLWDRMEIGRKCFAQAAQRGVRVDEAYLDKLSHQLLNYENELGSAAAQQALSRLTPFLQQVASRRSIGRLRGRLAANRALRNYHAAVYGLVPSECARAIVSDPRLIANRGILSAMTHSLVQIAAGGSGH